MIISNYGNKKIVAMYENKSHLENRFSISTDCSRLVRICFLFRLIVADTFIFAWVSIDFKEVCPLVFVINR